MRESQVFSHQNPTFPCKLRHRNFAITRKSTQKKLFLMYFDILHFYRQNGKLTLLLNRRICY